jgi:hypothetical protein
VTVTGTDRWVPFAKRGAVVGEKQLFSSDRLRLEELLSALLVACASGDMPTGRSPASSLSCSLSFLGPRWGVGVYGKETFGRGSRG